MIIALIAQGLTPVAQDCDMQSGDMVMEMSSHAHDDSHSMHNKSQAEQANPMHDCCDTLECSCLNGTCSNTLIATLDVTDENISLSSADTHQLTSQTLSAASQNLIRPPILA